ncbi:hypothetical protein B932_3786 (plasmid) [Gluconobacter oxydans H24]|nr:hypothetical protein B932_3786 [Gluconobacter oxydans H24]
MLHHNTVSETLFFTEEALGVSPDLERLTAAYAYMSVISVVQSASTKRT